MPIFDFRCEDCKKRFSLLIGVLADSPAKVCPSCGGSNIVKLVSRFSALRSEDDIIESLADPPNVGDLDDPRQLHSWMKRVGREMGEDLGEEFDDILSEAEKGNESES